MRRFALLLLALGIALPAFAAKRVTVEQLEKILSAAHGQSDKKVAHELAGLELTERASYTRLTRWESAFPGPLCREALTVLADSSAFLEPPVSDIPNSDTPEPAVRQAIFAKALDYAARTLKKLPNFSATRTTQYFEDTPGRETAMRMSAGQSAAKYGVGYFPLHPIGSSSTVVTYRDGTEVSGAKLTALDATQPGRELRSTGEFGPVLAIALADASAGTATWAYWEAGPTGTEAVFRYTVPVWTSHYQVELPLAGKVKKILPAYHGEIMIDPATGDVLRISVVADLPAPDDKIESAIEVEYGTVMIGDRPYVCPVKSIALSKIPLAESLGTAGPMHTELNDVAFTGYHLFRSESRILTGPDVQSEEAPAGTGEKK
jgi:hypothetical protein